MVQECNLLVGYDNKNMQNNTLEQDAHKTDHSGMILVAILGGLLLAFGLGKLISDLWPSFGPGTRVFLAVLGYGIAHTSGYYLTRLGNRAHTGTIFHLIGIFLLPLAFSVFFREMQIELSGAVKSFITTGFGAAAYTPFAFTRRTIFVLAGAGYSFLAVRSIINLIAGTNPIFDGYFDTYTFLVLGTALLLIGIHISQFVASFAKYAINLVASAVVAISGLMLSDAGRINDGQQFALWDVWFPVFMVGMLYLGMKLRLLPQIIFAIVGLLGTLAILISKYFDSISLPIMLSVVGLGLIAIAYFGVARSKGHVAEVTKM